MDGKHYCTSRILSIMKYLKAIVLLNCLGGAEMVFGDRLLEEVGKWWEKSHNGRKW